MRLTSVVLAATALSSLVSAQTQVPTRIVTEVYGINTPTAIALDFNVWGNWGENTTICLTGGAAGDPACIFVDLTEAALPTPWGSLLVPPTAVPVPGVFDYKGEFELPIDVTRTGWVGSTVHAQGLCLDLQAPSIQLSGGVKVAYREGHEQPPTGYTGPPITYAGPAYTGTLIRHESPFIDTMFSLVSQVAVPTHGYTIQYTDVQLVNNEVHVYVNLEAPHPSWDVSQDPTTVQLPIELGPTVGEYVRVFVWESVALIPSQPAYEEAAVIDTKF